MPSTRWHTLTVIAVYSTIWMNSVKSVELSESLPVASNGWRPIIGTHEVKTSQNTQHSTLSSNDQKSKNYTANIVKNGGGNQVHVNHHGSTGHHTKSYAPPPNKQYKPSSHGINHLHMMATGKPALRHPVMNKLHAHMALNGKRHKPSKAPMRLNLRDEIMAPAPSSALGTYAYYNQGPFSIQQQQTNTKFSNAPIDFSNHFGFSNSNPNDLVLQSSQFNFPKQPTQNELQQANFEYQQQQQHQAQQQLQQQQQAQQQLQQQTQQQQQNNHFIYFNQNDDFTRNLVPPPPHYYPQGETEIIQQKESVQKVKPENLQLPSPYSHFQDNQGLDLEITRENFKEFHTTLAPTYKTTTEPYSTKPRILKSSIHHQYEVTEEKDYNGFKVYSTRLPEQPQYKNVYPTSSPRFKYHFAQIRPQNVETSGQFLPTPYNPDDAFPTAPTQVEVSTIYSEISQLNQKKQHKYPTPDPAYIKEVATHFPIFEDSKPTTEPEYTNEVTTKETTAFQEVTQELTRPPPRGTTSQRRPNQRRRRPKPKTTTETPVAEIEYEAQTPETERPRRRRPMRYRTTEAPELTTEPIRSRPERIRSTLRPKASRPQTITEENYVSKNHRVRPVHNYDQEELQSSLQAEVTTREYSRYERPKEVRQRLQPIQDRYEEELQTTPEPEATTKLYSRYERPKETTLRLRPVQHNYEEELQTNPEPEVTTKQYLRFEHPQELQTQRSTPVTYDEEQYSKAEATTRQYSNFDRHQDKPQVEDDSEQYTTHTYTKFDRPTETYDEFKADTFDINPTTEFIRTYNDYKSTESDQPKLKKRKRIRPSSTTTTEVLSSSNLNIPENELDYTTTASDQSEEATVQEVYDFSPELTTVVTTPSSTTTVNKRTEATTKSNRIRPRPMKYDVQRPRFSVKDYRQRLNQYMSSSTTESTKVSSETPRIRYPTRFRNSGSSTTESDNSAEFYRQKFTPKDPRHKDNESIESTTEKQTRPITRIRPYGRHRVTTEATTTTQRVSIKPNIFNNLKRPQHLSLRNRIYNKMRNATTTTEQNTEEPDSEEYSYTEKTETTIPFEPAESKIEVTTQVFETRKPDTTTTEKEPEALFKVNDVMADVSVESPDEAEAFLQLQRIQDLTSSAHKQYNTPGMFKSVTQISRRVPSYFTIATEDPILPIEAFFPNLNRNY